MSYPETFELCVRHKTLGELRLLSGYRLDIETQYQRRPRGETLRHHDWLGETLTSPQFDIESLSPQAVYDWDLEIGDVGRRTSFVRNAVLSRLLGEGHGEALTDLASDLANGPMPWHAEWVAPVPPELQALGVAWFDAVVPSVNWRQGDMIAEPVVHFRRVRFIWAATWCITVWGARQGSEKSHYRTWGLPDRWGLPTSATGWTGQDRLARQLECLVGHIEWSVEMVDIELEDWENHFLVEAASAGLFQGTDVDRLQRHLAGTGSRDSLQS